jgi:hypothetical protein
LLWNLRVFVLFYKVAIVCHIRQAGLTDVAEVDSLCAAHIPETSSPRDIITDVADGASETAVDTSVSVINIFLMRRSLKRLSENRAHLV